MDLAMSPEAAPLGEVEDDRDEDLDVRWAPEFRRGRAELPNISLTSTL